ncbi:MAG: hypothetical protein ACLFPH_08345 [Bacteroidales bacterium]
MSGLESKLQQLQKRRSGELEDVKKHHTSWERVKIARMLERTKPQDYISHIVKDFYRISW